MARIKNNEVHRRDGKLSAYGFLCGYIERVQKNGSFKEIYMEHRHYHVRHGKIGEKIPADNWQVFERSENRQARQFYSSIAM